MKTELVPALRATLITLLLTGIAYPLFVTGAAQLLFPRRANGSLVTDDKGQVVGSELIAQGFDSDAYLWPRPSAAGEKGFDASGSSGSNLGPTSKALRERAEKELQSLRERNPDEKGPVPPELLQASGSGLDPHLSPDAALWQAARIAKARGVAVERVRAVIQPKPKEKPAAAPPVTLKPTDGIAAPREETGSRTK